MTTSHKTTRIHGVRISEETMTVLGEAGIRTMEEVSRLTKEEYRVISAISTRAARDTRPLQDEIARQTELIESRNSPGEFALRKDRSTLTGAISAASDNTAEGAPCAISGGDSLCEEEARIRAAGAAAERPKEASAAESSEENPFLEHLAASAIAYDALLDLCSISDIVNIEAITDSVEARYLLEKAGIRTVNELLTAPYETIPKTLLNPDREVFLRIVSGLVEFADRMRAGKVPHPSPSSDLMEPKEDPVEARVRSISWKNPFLFYLEDIGIRDDVLSALFATSRQLSVAEMLGSRHARDILEETGIRTVSELLMAESGALPDELRQPDMGVIFEIAFGLGMFAERIRARIGRASSIFPTEGIPEEPECNTPKHSVSEVDRKNPFLFLLAGSDLSEDVLAAFFDRSQDLLCEDIPCPQHAKSMLEEAGLLTINQLLRAQAASLPEMLRDPDQQITVQIAAGLERMAKTEDDAGVSSAKAGEAPYELAPCILPKPDQTNVGGAAAGPGPSAKTEDVTAGAEKPADTPHELAPGIFSESNLKSAVEPAAGPGGHAKTDGEEDVLATAPEDATHEVAPGILPDTDRKSGAEAAEDPATRMKMKADAHIAEQELEEGGFGSLFVGFDEHDESDMEVRDDRAPFEEKVFASNPLLGNCLLTAQQLRTCRETAWEKIDNMLKGGRECTLSEAMRITLMLVVYARDWDYEKSPEFWEYAAVQFGYKDNNSVHKFLQRCAEKALRENNRLFVVSENGREFRTTILIHALATRKSWMALLDFLFGLYRTNLGWQPPQEKDPFLLEIVLRIRKIMCSDADNTEDSTVFPAMYAFEVGIRTLVRLRPVFAAEEFGRLIRRIDAHIRSKVSKPRTYDEQLCDEWYREKVDSINQAKPASSHVCHGNTAADVTRIVPRYVLRDGREVRIYIPDVRLRRQTASAGSRILCGVRYGDDTAAEQRMSWYGDELGQTLCELEMRLPEAPCGQELAPTVSITCAGECWYDSETRLHRSVLFFSGTKEIPTRRLRPGACTIVCPANLDIRAEDVDMQEIKDFCTPGLRAYRAELGNGYVLSVDGRVLSAHWAQDTKMQVRLPAETEKLPVITASGREYRIAHAGSTCTVRAESGVCASQYLVCLNGEEKNLTEYCSGDAAFEIPLPDSREACTLQILDLAREKRIYEQSFFIMERAECRFSRDFYFSRADYADAFFTCTLDDETTVIPFSEDDEEIDEPFRSGELHMCIPKVRIEETSGIFDAEENTKLFGPSVPQDSILRVVAPDDLEVRILLGARNVPVDRKGIVTLGNLVRSARNPDERTMQLSMRVTSGSCSQTYPLAQIFWEEQFVHLPRFWTVGARMYWDCGGGFIGRPDRKFLVTFRHKPDKEYRTSLSATDETVCLPDEMEHGRYKFEICAESSNLFSRKTICLAKGICIYGDEDAFRFEGRRIVIDTITDSAYPSLGRIPIQKLCIDGIRFEGVQETSEGMCPVYTGVLYRITPQGDFAEFSSVDGPDMDGRNCWKLNPVRIIFRGSTTLCITDQDGDGLYYRRIYEQRRGRNIYTVTDEKYMESNMDMYSVADLYSYTIERATTERETTERATNV